MKKGTQISAGLKIAAVGLMLAMAWLTISTPFVFKQQQELAKENIQLPGIPPEEETHNPFSNSTEEKNESGTNTLSEFIHDHSFHSSASALTLRHNKSHVADVYVAFHGELLSPPPEI